MAVSSPTSALVYTGNGSAVTAYPVSFPFLLASDIFVAVTTAAGATTLLSAGVDYTLTPTPDSNGAFVGGNVVTAVAYNSSYTVTIFRQVPLTQLTELPEAGPFPALSIERSYDKLTMIVQQLHRRILELEGNGDGGAVLVVPEAPAGASGLGAQIFADGTARGNATPAAIGQLGYQVDDKSFWAASGLGAGSWAPANFAPSEGLILARKTLGAGGYEHCNIGDILEFTGAQNGTVLYREGGAWFGKPAGADIQAFTADGTWTKPIFAKWVEGYVIGAGGGGGSGRRGAAATQRYGGGGAGGGGLVYFSLPASSFPNTVPVVVGVGGVGAGAVTTNDTNGANGTAGTVSKFGDIEALGGGGGLGGTAAAGTGGGGGGASNGVTFGFADSKIASSGGTNGSTGFDTMAPSGGGGGGQITAANAPGAGGRGAHIYPPSGGSIRFALGGTGGAATGENGHDGSDTLPMGTGGGGGGAVLGALGGSGGNGARGGGGGGGGAASVNGFNSGLGGNGGSGYVIIASY